MILPAMRTRNKFILALLSATVLTTAPTFARAQISLDTIGLAPNTGQGSIVRFSDDGDAVLAYGDNGGGAEYYLLENSIWTAVGFLPGGSYSTAYDISGDGTTIVGMSENNSGDQEAFAWQNGVMTGLGDLAGGAFSSTAYGVNTDGSVIVGTSESANGSFEAFRWESGVMTGLGDLVGGLFSSTATDVSDDGSVVVGYGNGVNGFEAFRWVGGVMTGLGDFAGGLTQSSAQAVNADGSVVVGYGESANGTEAYRWTQAGGMVALGDLAGGTFASEARGVNADGTVVVGYSDAGTNSAFYWTQADGMQSIAQMLIDGGVDMTGWDLQNAADVSADGNIVTGSGALNAVDMGWIANLATGGVTTPEALAQGFVSAGVPAQQAQSAAVGSIGQSLFAATNAFSSINTASNYSMVIPETDEGLGAINPAAGGPSVTDPQWGVYAVGSFGIGQDNDSDNWGLNGTTGVVMQIDDELAIGGGVIGSTGRTDLAMGGESSLKSIGGSMIAAYEAPEGLRLYGSAFAAYLDVDIDRHYMNGAGIDESHGETDGIGYGAAVRGGWEFPIVSDFSIMPYGELQASKTKLDGYTETNGPFPAAFGDQDSRQLTSRIGAQVNHQLTDALKLGIRAAWAHRITDDQSALSVSTTGFTGTMGSEKGDRNWAEGAISAGWQVTSATSLSAELTGRTGKTQEPVGTLTMGIQVKF